MLYLGPGTILTVLPKVLVEKPTKSKDRRTAEKKPPLPTILHTKNISLELSPKGQSTSAWTTDMICMDRSDSSMIKILPVLNAIQGAEGASARVCSTTDPSAQDPEEQRVNMLSMAVLGLRVLLAKSIAFNTLMSIKLFLF